MHFKPFVLSFLLAAGVGGFVLPNPAGPYNVTMTSLPLTDHTRDGRTLMISIFQPAQCTSTESVLYMPRQAAEHEGPWIQTTFGMSADLTPVLLEAHLPVCSIISRTNCSSQAEAPVLLLSPGYRGIRSYYSHLASSIASEGYTVITMDHPGETNVIVYPDGHVEVNDLPNVENIDELTPLAYIRAADASFIIDQLNNATAMAGVLPKHLPSPTDRVVMAGHSLGGAASLLAAIQDSRVIGAVNWDGPFFGSLSPSGLDKPVLYIGTHREEPRFLAAWPKFHGAKLWVEIAGLLHPGLMDYGTVLEAAGVNMSEFADVLGTVAPTEVLNILTAFTTEWMKGALTGVMGGSLLNGTEPERFPEVEVVSKEDF